MYASASFDINILCDLLYPQIRHKAAFLVRILGEHFPLLPAFGDGLASMMEWPPVTSERLPEAGREAGDGRRG